MNVSSIGSSYSNYSFASLKSGQRTQGTQPDPAEFAAKIIEKEDKNKDGVIGSDESTLDSKRFSEMDTNGDGKLSTDELVASFKNRPAPPPNFGGKMDVTELASKILEKEDSNSDGVIGASETRLDSDRFKAWDTDSSGTLSQDELVAGLKSDQAQNAGGPPPMGPPPDENGDSSSTLQSLIDALSKSSASTAYGSTQNWLSSLLQSSQQLSVSA